MNKLKMQTEDGANDNINYIGEKFPNAITEVPDDTGKIIKKIDFKVLEQELASNIVDGDKERYTLMWPGKKEAILLSNSPISNTLRPNKKASVNFVFTKNLYIEGDNLLVLKLLKETYLGKLKMIYIDPPYNTGNDFIYSDNYATDTVEYLKKSNQMSSDGVHMVANTNADGRIHTDWLNMMYSRLRVSKDLLSDNGAIFISIDDNEQANLKKICDEIFGEQNFICMFIRQTRKGGGSMSRFVSTDHDYILMYARNISSLAKLFLPYDSNYVSRYKEQDEIGKFFWDTFARNRQGSSNFYTIVAPDGTKLQNAWIYKEVKFKELLARGDVRFKQTSNGWSVQCKQRISDDGQVMRSLLNDFTNEMGTKTVSELLGKDIFTYTKPYELIKHLATAMTNNDDIVMDFFSGSATTAQAVMQLNAEDGGHRRFIMVQIPEECSKDSEAYKAGYRNICEIGEERIRRAGNQIKKENPSVADSLDTGFRVLKLDSSNMKDVYYNPSEYTPDLFSSLEDNIKEDRTDEDLLFQVMLDLGIMLDSKIEEKTISGKKIFIVTDEDKTLICCFDKDVTDDVVTEIAKSKPDYAVFRDSSMSSDSVAINFEQIFKTYSPSTTRKVL